MASIEAVRNAIRTIPDFPKPGIRFMDITPVLADPDLLAGTVGHLAAPFAEAGITRVIGIEARGFILGGMLAERLGAGFVPVRKRGKLPYRTLREEYDLEYGSDVVEMHTDALGPNDRVLIHDDVIATGGTALATERLARSTGAKVVGYAFFIELDFLNGRRLLDPGLRIHSVIRV